MKAMALVPSAVAAILALNISSALSQGGACGKEYQACMDTCAARPKSVQDACFQNCEGKNTFCAEKVYGKRPANAAPSATAEQKGPANDAMAKRGEEAAQAQDAAQEQPAEEPRQPQRGQAPQQTQKAPQRAPAKR